MEPSTNVERTIILKVSGQMYDDLFRYAQKRNRNLTAVLRDFIHQRTTGKRSLYPSDKPEFRKDYERPAT